MKAFEVIIESNSLHEHSDWEVDPYYTEELMRKLHLVAMATQHFAHAKGIKLEFTKHFFDQIKLNRGSRMTAEQLMEACAAMLNRGLRYFKDKPNGTEYAFTDTRNDNWITMGVRKVDDDSFKVGTIVRDSRWIGKSPQINL